jgi:hypothetical protein
MLLLLLGLPGGAGAETGVAATYRERTIDLGSSWEGARICAVVAGDDVRCFDTDQEMASAGLAGGVGVVSAHDAADCPSGWFCLWSGQGFGGARRLQFRERFQCQSLAPYGFANQARSYWNRTQSNVGMYDLTTCRSRLRLVGPNASSAAIAPSTSAIYIF